MRALFTVPQEFYGTADEWRWWIRLADDTLRSVMVEGDGSRLAEIAWQACRGRYYEAAVGLVQLAPQCPSGTETSLLWAWDESTLNASMIPLRIAQALLEEAPGLYRDISEVLWYYEKFSCRSIDEIERQVDTIFARCRFRVYQMAEVRTLRLKAIK